MLKLSMYSPWNGYPDLQDALSSGATYDVAEYDEDISSYTPIQDAIDAIIIATNVMVGVDKPHFMLSRGDTMIELTPERELGAVISELLTLT